MAASEEILEYEYESESKFGLELESARARGSSAPPVLASPAVASTRRLPPADVLHQFFETQADRRPDQVALECGGERLTYAELDRAANRLAHWLRRQGVARGSLVALWLPRSVDAYVALLAVLKAGAGYVPLDPDYPLERVEFVLADSRAAVLVTHSSLVGEDRRLEPVVLRLDRSRNELDQL